MLTTHMRHIKDQANSIFLAGVRYLSENGAITIQDAFIAESTSDFTLFTVFNASGDAAGVIHVHNGYAFVQRARSGEMVLIDGTNQGSW